MLLPSCLGCLPLLSFAPVFVGKAVQCALILNFLLLLSAEFAQVCREKERDLRQRHTLVRRLFALSLSLSLSLAFSFVLRCRRQSVQPIYPRLGLVPGFHSHITSRQSQQQQQQQNVNSRNSAH